MRIISKPYLIIGSPGVSTAQIFQNRSEIIYPSNFLHQEFIDNAINHPLERSLSVEIDCGKYNKGGDFIAGELNRMISEDRLNIRFDVEKGVERRPAWRKVLSFPSINTFLWMRRLETNNSSEGLLDYGSWKESQNDGELLEPGSSEIEYFPGFISAERKANNIFVKVIEGQEKNNIFTDIESKLNEGQTVEIIGTDFAGVQYMQGLLLKKDCLDKYSILVDMNGRNFTYNQYELEYYEELLCSIIKDFTNKGKTVVVDWDTVQPSEIYHKFENYPFQQIDGEVYVEKSVNDNGDSCVISYFKP